MHRWLISCLILLGLTAGALAETPPAFDSSKYMRVSEVHAGMTGYGLSVFSGTKIDRFNVEVVSVLKNFNPKSDGLGPNTDIVLVRCSGQNLEHTGAIEGMSGSPIYLKDDSGKYRMIGAFAYGWPLAKDPVGGVQPIEQMLQLTTQRRIPSTHTATNASAGSRGVTWSYPEFLDELRNRVKRLETQRPVGFDTAGVHLQPLATPIAVSGMPADLLNQFSALAGGTKLSPMQTMSTGGDGHGPGTKLEPGSVLAVPLLMGDMDLTAIGTCTEVIGDKVYGFGHAFNNEGAISLPMGSGEIYTVIANLMTSFKMGALTQIQGTLNTDELFGVAGQTGSGPGMIPITLHVIYADGSEDHVYHMKMAAHPKLTPLIGAVSVSAAIGALRDLPQYHTLDYDLNLDFANGQSVHLVNEMVNTQPQDIMFAIGVPMMMAAENPFERVMVKSVSGTLRITPRADEAKIQSVQVPKQRYKPGDTVRAYVSYRPFRGVESILPIEMELPRDLEEGTYQVLISDWQNYLQMEQTSRPFRFTAQSTNEVFAVLRDLANIRRNAVYLTLVRDADGVAIGRTAMPNMPSSRRQVLLEAGRSDITPFLSSKTKVIPTDDVMDGSASFQITVESAARIETTAGIEQRPQHSAEAAPSPKPSDEKPQPDTDKSNPPDSSDQG